METNTLSEDDKIALEALELLAAELVLSPQEISERIINKWTENERNVCAVLDGKVPLHGGLAYDAGDREALCGLVDMLLGIRLPSGLVEKRDGCFSLNDEFARRLLHEPDEVRLAWLRNRPLVSATA